MQCLEKDLFELKNRVPLALQMPDLQDKLRVVETTVNELISGQESGKSLAMEEVQASIRAAEAKTDARMSTFDARLGSIDVLVSLGVGEVRTVELNP